NNSVEDTGRVAAPTGCFCSPFQTVEVTLLRRIGRVSARLSVSACDQLRIDEHISHIHVAQQTPVGVRIAHVTDERHALPLYERRVGGGRLVVTHLVTLRAVDPDIAYALGLAV